jgi:hypothetical protein
MFIEVIGAAGMVTTIGDEKPMCFVDIYMCFGGNYGLLLVARPGSKLAP